MTYIYPETWNVCGYLIDEWRRNGHDLAIYEIKEIGFSEPDRRIQREYFAVIDGFKIRAEKSLFVHTLDEAIELANKFADNKDGVYKIER